MSAGASDAPRGFIAMADYLRLQRKCDDLEAELAERRGDTLFEATEDAINTVRAELKIGRQASILLLFLMASKRPLEPNERLCELVDAGHPHHVAVVLSRANKQIREGGGPKHVTFGLAGINGGRRMSQEGRVWMEARLPQIFGGAKP